MKRQAWAVAIFLLSGCDSEPTGMPPEAGLIGSFRLKNNQGIRTSTFAYGEDLFLEYRLSNRTGSDLRWSEPYGVLAGFSILLGQSGTGQTGMGSTLYGRIPQQNASSPLRNGSSLAYETTRLSNPYSVRLPPGEYELWADCVSEFEDHPPLAQQFLHFRVVSPGEEHVFSLFQDGWCWGEGDLYWASIFRSPRGKYTLTGAVLVESEAGMGGCVTELVTEKCLRQSIIGPRMLSGSEVATLLRLLAEFPQVQPEADPNTWCDPCGTTRYHFGTAVHGVSGCATGPPEYVAHALDLATFVTTVALEP